MLKIFLKFFFASSISFGFVMGVLIFIKNVSILPFSDVLPVVFKEAVVAGLAFSIPMSLILVPLHSVAFKSVINRIMPVKNYEPRQIYTFSVAADSQLLLKCIFNLLKNEKNIRNVQIDENKHSISAVRTGGWKSYKDDISVQLIPEEKITKVEVKSSPSKKLTILDYGQNYSNILLLYKFISSQYECCLEY
jgi:hypothetical protein